MLIWVDDYRFYLGEKTIVFFFEPNWGEVKSKHMALIALLKSIANIPLFVLTPITYAVNWLAYYTRLPDDQTQIERLKKWADKNETV